MLIRCRDLLDLFPFEEHSKAGFKMRWVSSKLVIARRRLLLFFFSELLSDGHDTRRLSKIKGGHFWHLELELEIPEYRMDPAKKNGAQPPYRQT